LIPDETVDKLVYYSNNFDFCPMKRKNAFVEENEENESDEELEAEINAVLAMKAEKLAKPIQTESKYNKEALLRAVDDLESKEKNFLQSFQICGEEVIIDDENDDLTREVCKYY
jgi:hypothetical protein